MGRLMTKEEQQNAADINQVFLQNNPQCQLRLNEQQQQVIDELRQSILNTKKQENDMMEIEKPNEEPYLGRCTRKCGNLECISHGCQSEELGFLGSPKKSYMSVTPLPASQPEVVAFSEPTSVSQSEDC